MPTCWSPAPVPPAPWWAPTWSPPPCAPRRAAAGRRRPGAAPGRRPGRRRGGRRARRGPRDAAGRARRHPGSRSTAVAADDIAAAHALVEPETALLRAERQAAEVAPTVSALRSQAAEVVDAELLRLSTRLPDLDARDRAEIARTVRRVVDKLLHEPTVRVKELASRARRHGLRRRAARAVRAGHRRPGRRRHARRRGRRRPRAAAGPGCPPGPAEATPADPDRDGHVPTLRLGTRASSWR